MSEKSRKVLIVTGMSGAGLSTALNALEDIGYKAVDNLPLALVDSLLDSARGQNNPVAIGVDSRTWDFNPAQLLRDIDHLRRRMDIALLFLDCDDTELQQRFSLTRRLHPMAADRPLHDGIAAERKTMTRLRQRADDVIDTTRMTVHDLRRHVAAHYAPDGDSPLRVVVTSFSFKQGLPREADLVFDVRFLKNPHWDPDLRPLTGLDAPVARAIRTDPDYDLFYKNLTSLLDPLLPRYDHEGKSYLTVAVGCSGGKHRSVFVADTLGKWIAAKKYAVTVVHRDMPRAKEKAPRKTATAGKRKVT